MNVRPTNCPPALTLPNTQFFHARVCQPLQLVFPLLILHLHLVVYFFPQHQNLDILVERAK